VIEVS